MAGAIDLFAGINPIAGANLFTVNKNPLIQIDQGVEDVIGQQAQHLGFDISQLIQALINQILGMGLKFLEDLFGSFPKGTLDDVALFFSNLLKFLGELDPLSPTFDPVTAAAQFANLVLLPTHLIAPLVEDATVGLGLSGFVPMENIAVEQIGNIIGTAQSVIDAILETVGFVAGVGTPTDLNSFFTDLLKILGNPALTSPTFSAIAAVEHFITSMIQPTNLLAAMDPATQLIDAINIPPLTAAWGRTVSGALLNDTVAANLITGDLTNSTLAAQKLTTGDIQAGVTIAGSALRSAITEESYIPSLTSAWPGTLEGARIVGAINAAIITGVLGQSQIPPLTSTWGRTIAATVIQGALDNANIAGSALTSAVSPANVPGLPAGWGKTIDGSLIVGAISATIITGVLNQAQIPSLTSSWGQTIDGAVLTNAITTATLAASKLTSGAIPAGVTIAGSALTSAITAANVPALPAGWGKTIDGALIAGTVLSTAVIPPITPPMTTGLALIDDVTNAIQATSIVGNTVAQMQYALANMPHVNVQPLVGTVATDLGGSLQAHIDAGIQAITGSTVSGNPLSLFQTALGHFTSHVGLVTVNQPYVSPSSVTAVSQTNSSYIQQQSINYEIQHGVDPTSSGPFNLSLVAPAALTTIAVSQGTAVQCFDQLPFGGVKQSIRWLGYPASGASFTDFRVNIYRLDTTTGIETLVYASENIAAGISAGSIPVWKAYNIPSGAVQTLSLGTSAIPPVGPGFPYTFPFTLVAARSFTLTFSGQTTTAVPYPATAVAIQNALAALSNIGSGNVLVADNGGGDFFITFAGAMAATTHPLITVNSANLPNATPTVTDFLAAAQGNVFAAEIVVTGTGSYNIVGMTNNLPAHPNAIPARFGATRAVGSLGFTYVAATPWIGLASTTAASTAPPTYLPPTFNPVLQGWGSSTVIQNPAVTYPLANYFDVIVFGAGGGGGGAGAASGGVGGYAAAHNIWTGVTRALMGTAGLTVTVGGGGGGGIGGSTGSPGGNGAGSSVVIPGWTTLSAGGGPGGGTGGPTYGGAGQSESAANWNDAYGNPHSIPGGAGGAGGGFSSPAAGSQSGGGGAGGTSVGYGSGWGGGPGGAGAVYIYCYQ